MDGSGGHVPLPGFSLKPPDPPLVPPPSLLVLPFTHTATPNTGGQTPQMKFAGVGLEPILFK